MTVIGWVLDQTVLSWIIRILGLALLAGTVTAVVGLAYRSRFRDTFPDGGALIVGLGAVAVYLNTRILLTQFVMETGESFTMTTAVGNIGIFVGAGIASLAGRTAGDRLARVKRFQWWSMEPTLSPIVRARGRFISVTLPEQIDDIDGYDPVAAETKAQLSGVTFEFSRGLTRNELESQLTDRLKESHDIGYVDVELTVEGEVEYLGLGQRVAGLGPALPPGTCAVAVRTDPPFSASPGDMIELWGEPDDGPLGVGELRASISTVATIACDSSVAEAIDPNQRYRLLTLPADARPDREFAAMLRRAPETMGVIEISEGSPLVGMTVGAIDATIIAIENEEEVVTLPRNRRPLHSGDRLFILGRPDELRKLESERQVTAVAPSDAIERIETAVDEGSMGLTEPDERTRISPEDDTTERQ